MIVIYESARTPTPDDKIVIIGMVVIKYLASVWPIFWRGELGGRLPRSLLQDPVGLLQ